MSAQEDQEGQAVSEEVGSGEPGGSSTLKLKLSKKTLRVHDNVEQLVDALDTAVSRRGGEGPLSTRLTCVST